MLYHRFLNIFISIIIISDLKIRAEFKNHHFWPLLGLSASSLFYWLIWDFSSGLLVPRPPYLCHYFSAPNEYYSTSNFSLPSYIQSLIFLHIHLFSTAKVPAVDPKLNSHWKPKLAMNGLSL